MDGKTDLMIGDPGEKVRRKERAGQAYVMQSTDRTVRQVLHSSNPEEQGAFGSSLSGIGDVDGDGTADVVVGAPTESVSRRKEAGRAYMMDVREGRVLQVLRAPKPGDLEWFGEAVSGCGDVNGDGVPDVLVGEPSERVRAPASVGRAHVIGGADGNVLQTYRPPDPAFRDSRGFGGSVSGMGGTENARSLGMIIGAPYKSVQDMYSAGRVYIITIPRSE